LKLHIYGYLNRVQSSRRLEREAGRNVEWSIFDKSLNFGRSAIAALARSPWRY
jgi:hypothetical protein